MFKWEALTLDEQVKEDPFQPITEYKKGSHWWLSIRKFFWDNAIIEFIRKYWTAGEQIALAVAFLALAGGPVGATVAFSILLGFAVGMVAKNVFDLGIVQVWLAFFGRDPKMKKWRELWKARWKNNPGTKEKVIMVARVLFEVFAKFGEVLSYALTILSPIVAAIGCGMVVFGGPAAPIFFSVAFGLGAAAGICMIPTVLVSDRVRAAWRVFKKDKSLRTFIGALSETLKVLAKPLRSMLMSAAGFGAVYAGLIKAVKAAGQILAGAAGFFFGAGLFTFVGESMSVDKLIEHELKEINLEDSEAKSKSEESRPLEQGEMIYYQLGKDIKALGDGETVKDKAQPGIQFFVSQLGGGMTAISQERAKELDKLVVRKETTEVLGI